MEKCTKTALLDCNEGRRMGCKTFCCRLLVRLEEHERHEIDPETNKLKSYVDKTKTGLCIHLDMETGRCQNWRNRPTICRVYDCNYDPLLQAVIRTPGRRITDWLRASIEEYIPKENYKYVPYLEIEEKP